MAEKTAAEKEAEVQRLLDEIQKTLKQLNERLDRLDEAHALPFIGNIRRL